MSLMKIAHKTNSNNQQQNDSVLLVRLIRNDEEINKFLLIESLLETLVRKRDHE